MRKIRFLQKLLFKQFKSTEQCAVSNVSSSTNANNALSKVVILVNFCVNKETFDSPYRSTFYIQ